MICASISPAITSKVRANGPAIHESFEFELEVEAALGREIEEMRQKVLNFHRDSVTIWRQTCFQ